MANHTETNPLSLLCGNQNLEMLEAAIPYVGSNLVVPLALFIKVNEMNHLLRNVRNTENLSACGLDKSQKNPEALLHAMQEKAPKEQANQIETILNILNATKLYRSYQDMTKDGVSASNENSQKESNPSNKPHSSNDLLQNLLPLLFSNSQNSNSTSTNNAQNELLKQMQQLLNQQNKK